MTRASAGALTVLPSTMLFNQRRRLVDLAANNPMHATLYDQDAKRVKTQSKEYAADLRLLQAKTPGDLEGAFVAAKAQKCDALISIGGSVTTSRKPKRTAELAAKYRLPAVYFFREIVEAGGLMSYGSHTPDLLRRSASYVDKILKGAKPGDLPIEQPMKFELLINMSAAKALGLTIPPSPLLRADQVIQ